MSIRGSQDATFIDADSVKLTNVELPVLPPQLVGVFDVDDWFRVYINGVLIPYNKYNYTSQKTSNEITFNFGTGSLDGDGRLVATATELGYILESGDEFGITGKFLEL
jgi:hypothetical protein